MILVGLGSNLPGPWGSPSSTLRKAIAQLHRGTCHVVSASSLLRSAPFGKTDQPEFVNAVVHLTTSLNPEALLAHLLEMEILAGRDRQEKWGPRCLDLDLLDYNGQVREAPPPVLPHPGIEQRPFVLQPIAEIAPDWRHPILGRTAAELLEPLRAQAEGRILDG